MASLIALITLLPGCSNNPDLEAELSAATPLQADTEAISRNPSDYIGKTILIREEIEEVVGTQAFLLDEDQLFGGQEILVVNASDDALPSTDDDDTDVQITGEVRVFGQVNFEQTYGLDLDPVLFSDYEQQPVIVAQSIMLAPDPDDINEDPEAYYNRRIALQGKIDENLSNNLMTLDDETLLRDKNILILSPNADLSYEPRAEVVIIGTLRTFEYTDFDKAYNLGWDLDFQRAIEAKYKNQPVLVAEEIFRWKL